MRRTWKKWLVLVIALCGVTGIGIGAFSQFRVADIIEEGAASTATFQDDLIRSKAVHMAALDRAAKQVEAATDPIEKLQWRLDEQRSLTSMLAAESNIAISGERLVAQRDLVDALRVGAWFGIVALILAASTVVLLYVDLRRTKGTSLSAVALLALLLAVGSVVVSLASLRIPASDDTHLARDTHIWIAVGMVLLIVAVELARFFKDRTASSERKEWESTVDVRLGAADSCPAVVEARPSGAEARVTPIAGTAVVTFVLTLLSARVWARR